MVRRSILVFSWLFLGGMVFAGDEPVRKLPPTPLAVGHLDPSTLIPAPPAPGSLAEQADLETVLLVQAFRSAEQEAWARRIDTWTLWDFADVLGPWFKPASLPTLRALDQQMAEELRAFSQRAKALHPRLRPPSSDPRVRPCLTVARDKSYPSGHAQALCLQGELLGEIFPEHREALKAWAQRAMWSRVIGGAHFPSDIVAGRLLGEAVMAELRRSDAFRAAVERCRAEAAPFRLKKAG